LGRSFASISSEPPGASLKTLLIDNHDSFTYNLFQLLAAVNGEEPEVVRNDAAPWTELAGLGFDNVVISPGPGRPEEPRDFGVCADAIRAARVPLLGVCLGHQGVGHIAGAAVVHAPEVMHGRLSSVYHDGSELFAGIPQGFQVVRYHSLCLTEPLPEALRATAWTSDGVLMGVAHAERPIWGVQFHPESICTEWGRRLLENFGDLTGLRARPRPAPAPRRPKAPPALTVRTRRLDSLHDPEQLFTGLYAGEDHAFWLDTSMVDEGSRFSFMGAAGGPLSSVVTYDVAEHRLEVRSGGETEVRDQSIFDYLSEELQRRRVRSDELPFDFNGGFVGWFGYELKADCDGRLRHRSTMPDAAFLFADRLIAIDHRAGCTYLVSVGEGDEWLREMESRLEELPPLSPPEADGGGWPDFRLSRSRERHLEDIGRIKRHLTDGETYEVCLTNKVHADISPAPLPLYRTLRRVNPAPFSSYLRFGEYAVLSSSPERFLRVGRDRWMEAKPVKGTTPRGRDRAEDLRLAEQLRTSEKNRAENLMITDVLRNDLGMVCEVGTVDVPHLMAIESYETVHQLVSTVRGRLREDIAPPQGMRACFPGGSMTGAPKQRTMEIIDELEGEPRGVYSGAIGYLGLSGGCDLSIVIRTIVMDGGSTTVGTGGAIVMQSDPEDEYQEALLKASALMRALAAHAPEIRASAAAPRPS
jgi:para-aminobenzoate synthetase